MDNDNFDAPEPKPRGRPPKNSSNEKQPTGKQSTGKAAGKQSAPRGKISMATFQQHHNQGFSGMISPRGSQYSSQHNYD